MTKKLITLSVVAALVACMSSSVSADPFEDVWDDGFWISGSGSSVSFTHDITDDVTIPGDTIESADLALSFTDDGGFDLWEYVDLDLDGNQIWNDVEVSTETYDVAVATSYLASDGLLNVTVTGAGGDVYLNSSTLSGSFTPYVAPPDPPIANAGGPYELMQGGGSITLAGSATGGPYSAAAWDLDEDGVFDDATGLDPSISTAMVAGYAPGTTWDIELQLTGPGGSDISTAQLTYAVIPVPGAILLGILGLSAAGIKLRKFA